MISFERIPNLERQPLQHTPTDIRRIESTPIKTAILDQWYIAYHKVNKAHPQSAVALSALTGRSVFQSIKSGQVDLSYLAASQFTTEQTLDLQNTVAELHRRFNAKAMPLGHGPIEHQFPNSYFEDTWSLVSNSIIQAIVNFSIEGEQQYYSQELLAFSQLPQRELLKPAPRHIISELSQITNSRRFKARIGMLEILFKTAHDAFLSREALTIARERLDNFKTAKHISEPNSFYPKDLTQVQQLARIARKAILLQAMENHIPLDMADQFYSDITGFEL